MRESEHQSVVVFLFRKLDGAGLLALLLQLEAKAFNVFLDKHLLGFYLHVGHGALLELDVAVEGGGALEHVLKLHGLGALLQETGGNQRVERHGSCVLLPHVELGG